VTVNVVLPKEIIKHKHTWWYISAQNKTSNV